MELRGIRLVGELDELRVSSGRIMNAYPDRRRDEKIESSTPQTRRKTPKSAKKINPIERWVVSGFFLISSLEAKRWTGVSDLNFESDGLHFHIVSIEPWNTGNSNNGFETWNFRALCAPEVSQIERLPRNVILPTQH